MKKVIGFTVDSNLIKDFNELTKEKFINKSKLIESFIASWVSNFKPINKSMVNKYGTKK